MKLVEFRIAMPLTVEEYRLCQLYLVAKGALEDSENNVSNVNNGNSSSGGIVILKNESYKNEDGTSGQYTFKKINMLSKIPKWLLNFVDPKYCTIEEKSWNSYPYVKTTFESNGFPKAKVQVESTHHLGYDTEDNALNISNDLLSMRKIIYIDIANDKLPIKDYNPDEDPTLYFSKKTKRGKLDTKWKENSKIIMTCYKLFSINIPYFGIFCSKLENWIIGALRDNLLKYHRKAFCWMDEWIDLSLEDIRNIEKEVQEKLDKIWNKSSESQGGIDTVPNGMLEAEPNVELGAGPNGNFSGHSSGPPSDDSWGDSSRDSPNNCNKRTTENPDECTENCNSLQSPTSQIILSKKSLFNKVLNDTSANTKDVHNTGSNIVEAVQNGSINKDRMNNSVNNVERDCTEKLLVRNTTCVESLDSVEKGKPSNKESYVVEKKGRNVINSEGISETHAKLVNVDNSVDSALPCNSVYKKGIPIEANDIQVQKKELMFSQEEGEVDHESNNNVIAKSRSVMLPGVSNTRERILRECDPIDEEEEKPGENQTKRQTDGQTEKQPSGPPHPKHRKKGILTEEKKEGEVESDCFFFFKRNVERNEYGEYLYRLNDGMFYSWKLRYFTLKNNKLSYYINDTKSELKGEIDLLNAQIQWIGEYRGRNSVFVVNSLSKSVSYLSLDNEIQTKKCMIDVQMATLINNRNLNIYGENKNGKKNKDMTAVCEITPVKRYNSIDVINMENMNENVDGAKRTSKELTSSNVVAGEGEIGNERKGNQIDKAEHFQKDTNIDERVRGQNECTNGYGHGHGEGPDGSPVESGISTTPNDQIFCGKISGVERSDECSGDGSCDGSTECGDRFPMLGEPICEKVPFTNGRGYQEYTDRARVEKIELNGTLPYNDMCAFLQSFHINLEGVNRRIIGEFTHHMDNFYVHRSKNRKKKNELFYIFFCLFSIFSCIYSLIVLYRYLRFVFYLLLSLFLFLYIIMYNDYTNPTCLNSNMYKCSVDVPVNINSMASFLMSEKKYLQGEFNKKLFKTKNSNVRFLVSSQNAQVKNPFFNLFFHLFKPRVFYHTQVLGKHWDVCTGEKGHNGKRSKEERKENMRAYLLIQYTNENAKKFFKLKRRTEESSWQINKERNHAHKGVKKDQKGSNISDFSEGNILSEWWKSTVSTSKRKHERDEVEIDYSSKKETFSNFYEIKRMCKFLRKMSVHIFYSSLEKSKFFLRYFKKNYYYEYVRGEGMDLFLLREKGDNVCNVDYFTCYDYKSFLFNDMLNYERCSSVRSALLSRDNMKILGGDSRATNLSDAATHEGEDAEETLRLEERKIEKNICRQIFFNINNEKVSRNMVQYIFHLRETEFMNKKRYVSIVGKSDDVFFMNNLSKVFLHLIENVRLHEFSWNGVERIDFANTQKGSQGDEYSDSVFIANVIHILKSFPLLYNTFSKSYIFPKRGETFKGAYKNSKIHIDMRSDIPILFSLTVENSLLGAKIASDFTLKTNSTFDHVRIMVEEEICIKNKSDYELKVVLPNICLRDLLHGNLYFFLCGKMVITDSLNNHADIEFMDTPEHSGHFFGIIRRYSTITNVLSGNVFDNIHLNSHEEEYGHVKDVRVKKSHDKIQPSGTK
ncbi:phosphatidylinositol transfer protein, putative [Plasmodium ovale curtisi]|uniref:Phosphatidylinositol transfer protein, putative n=1 Tax=Plasmodium ovale curtisi TaxID=864141 RepID=A0A1A8VYQ8_PLAOA|nr:phosphatidylinositol transfer protein, putative [Plasmodium ovale curtisi]